MKKFIAGLLIGLVLGVLLNGVTYFNAGDNPEGTLRGIEVYLFGHTFRPVTWE